VHDERPQARRRLELLVRSVAGVDAVLATRDADDLLERVATGPGAMVVIGLADAEPTGVETVRRVLGSAPGAAVLVAGSADVRGPAQDALAEGAVGFLRWDAPRAMIRTLVRTAVSTAAGESLLPTVGGEASGDDDGAPAGLREVRIDVAVQRRLDLSVREVQVLIGVSRGLTNAEIGRRLYLSDHTIKTHTGHVFRKLGAADRAQAVSHAWRAGLFVGGRVPVPSP
jgi:DNA-binding NarL/FixJ family response regulator